MPRRSGSLELDVAAVALLVVVIGVAAAAYRMRRQAADLGTADRQLRRLTKHNGEQGARIAELEEESPSHMITSMEEQMGEMMLELDGPAGADVDLRRGVPGLPNPALAEPPREGDEIVLPGAEPRSWTDPDG